MSITSRASRAPVTLGGFFADQDDVHSTRLSGGLLSIDAADRRELVTTRLSLGGTVARLETATSGQGVRALGQGSTSLGLYRYPLGIRRGIQIGAAGALGTSVGGRVERGAISASIELPSLTVSGTAGISRSASAFERFSIGGPHPSILHPNVLTQRIAMPVLPPNALTGEKLASFRVTTPLAGLRAYFWGGQAWSAETPRLHKVAGAEWSTAMPQIPTLGTPAFRVTIGAGKWLTAPAAETLAVGGTTFTARRRSPVQFYLTTQFGDWAR